MSIETSAVLCMTSTFIVKSLSSKSGVVQIYKSVFLAF